ncbi:MAG: Gfo/Idh/MocA family oxidoreductase [Wujia sp.]
MIKVITYGTFDLLHYGHIKLLERAKALGDYLIVGVTADDFDKTRGKINVSQSLMERVEAVKGTGIADEIIIEEYEGQKIDDIKRYDIDIFTVGSDWIGKFDYLKEYCEVIYLERTKGISSTELRAEQKRLKLGIIGDTRVVEKYISESEYVNGVEVVAVCTSNQTIIEKIAEKDIEINSVYESMLDKVDAVYIASLPECHYQQIKCALQAGKHVLCESPIAMSRIACQELLDLAKQQKLILMDAIKTAYATAYNRMILLAKSGKIGKLVSVDSTCTSLKQIQQLGSVQILNKQNSMCAWGPTAVLPILQLLGKEGFQKKITSAFLDENKGFDLFTRISFYYPDAVATLKVGKGVKSEGELIISGTRGYIYVPAPWWKTEYFEVRYENSEDNKRYFYQLDGEGIRYEMVSFMKSIELGKAVSYVDGEVSLAIAGLIDDFNCKRDFCEIMI